MINVNREGEFAIKAKAKDLIYSDVSHVGILDGVRTIAVFLIVFFHYWQLNWLQYYIPSDILSFIGYKNFNFDWIVRYGYLCVELLFILSSFLLFLPVARGMVSGNLNKLDIKNFYKKRIARIVPSYFLVLAFSLIFIVRPSDYPNIWYYLKDLFSHLTFTQTFWVDTHISTKYFGVVWSLSVEVLFYIIFPFVAWCFKKHPLLTYGVMVILGEAYLWLVPIGNPDSSRFTILQFPAYLSVYANGMMGAYVFVILAGKLRKKAVVYGASTLGFLAALWTVRYLVRFVNADMISGGAPIQIPQAKLRFILSALYVIAILCCAFSVPFIRFLFSNRLMRFLSMISYNLYLWHQFIGATLIKYKIPYYPDSAISIYGGPQKAAGEPWQLGWQIGFALTAIPLAVLTAYLLTRFWEQPMSNIILKKKPILKPF